MFYPILFSISKSNQYLTVSTHSDCSSHACHLRYTPISCNIISSLYAYIYQLNKYVNKR